MGRTKADPRRDGAGQGTASGGPIRLARGGPARHVGCDRGGLTSAAPGAIAHLAEQAGVGDSVGYLAAQLEETLRSGEQIGSAVAPWAVPFLFHRWPQGICRTACPSAQSRSTRP